MPATASLIVRHLGRVDYQASWRDMQEFTRQRTPETPDELWFLEHPPVYTLGRNGKRKHLREAGAIPVINVDRGGQVTYHGPGQLIIYTLLDIQRRQLGVQSLVRLLEQAVIDLCSHYGIRAGRQTKAPGVYVAGRKLAALGLRVRKGCCFHGLSLNIDMDLAPFENIDPCGFQGLEVTQLKQLGVDSPLDTVSKLMQHRLENLLDKNSHEQQ